MQKIKQPYFHSKRKLPAFTPGSLKESLNYYDSIKFDKFCEFKLVGIGKLILI